MFGTTLVLITHDLELAERAQFVIRLKGGQVVEQGDHLSAPLVLGR
jgi:predicted ABC-type transport system involved in lysophospholipase L1 biosynthesis ATPase subunit